MWSVSIASATWSDASAAIPVASLRGGCPSTPSRARSPKFRYCRKSSAFEFAPYCASQCDSCFPWRRGWGSKPRGSCEPSGFQVLPHTKQRAYRSLKHNRDPAGQRTHAYRRSLPSAARHAPSVDKESRARRPRQSRPGGSEYSCSCVFVCMSVGATIYRCVAQRRVAQVGKGRDRTAPNGGGPVLGKIGGRRISSVFGGQ